MYQMINFNLFRLKATDSSLPSGVNTLAINSRTHGLTPVVTEKF